MLAVQVPPLATPLYSSVKYDLNNLLHRPSQPAESKSIALTKVRFPTVNFFYFAFCVKRLCSFFEKQYSRNDVCSLLPHELFC